MGNTFKKVIDRQIWVPVQATPNLHSAGNSLCSDLRNTVARNPFMYQLVSATILNRFNIITKGWSFLQSPALGGTFGAGASCVFVPSFSLMGSIGAGCTTTSIVTTTTLTTVGVNMLANRGGSGDYGFRVRIIGNSAGGSGLIEEKWIIANSGGTTPTLLLDSALTFTPAVGDTYEILSGRVFMLSAGATAVNTWRSLEVGTNTLATLATSQLPATVATESSLVALDEQYVPYTREPGEGMIVGAATYSSGGLNCLVATASGVSSLTGQAAAGDAAVGLNEYRNYQIRVVEDSAIPTAVNQRRIIASHSSGPSPVYVTGTTWAVTPSATTKFVIELPNLILLRSSATATIYTYNYTSANLVSGSTSINSNTWSTTYFGASGGTHGAGAFWCPSFGIVPDSSKNSRQSDIFFFRGGGTSILDVFNFSGATTGAWTSAIVYDGAQLFTTGSCGEYAPFDTEGRMTYINFYTASVLNQIFRFDSQNRVLSPYTPTDWVQSGTAAVGKRIATYCAIDGTDKYTCVNLLSHTATNDFELIVQT